MADSEREGALDDKKNGLNVRNAESLQEDYTNARIPSGSEVIDSLLNGGYERDIVTTVYGPPGSGKTTVCLIAVKKALETGGKAIYIDTEGSFSVERFLQLFDDKETGLSYLDRIYIVRPSSFEEQKQAFNYLKEKIRELVSIIVVDSISMLYRAEIGDKRDIPETSRALSSQMTSLVTVAGKNKIPVIVTSQVYSSVEGNDRLIMYGGEFMKYASKCLVELEFEQQMNTRNITLRKHRSIESGKRKGFTIEAKGIF